MKSEESQMVIGRALWSGQRTMVGTTLSERDRDTVRSLTQRQKEEISEHLCSFDLLCVPLPHDYASCPSFCLVDMHAKRTPNGKGEAVTAETGNRVA